MILNGVMAVILCYFSEFGSFRGALRKSGYRVFHRIFVYSVDVKQLLGLPRFQNLLLIVYDHIKTICMRNYSAIIWAKQTDNLV